VSERDYIPGHPDHEKLKAKKAEQKRQLDEEQ
jgi:hypothetical protein